MPAYSALNTQIEAVKAEITASLAASTYTAQDLVYVAKALETLGNLLGINDLVAASAQAQADLAVVLGAILDGTSPAVANKLYIGVDPQAFETTADLTNALAVFKFDNGSEDASFAQIAFTNADPTSSSDIQIFMDNGTDTNGWIDLGITGSTFSDPDYPITYAGDGYLFVNGKPSYKGNLVFGTGAGGTENKIVFAAGGYASGNTQMTIIPDTRVHVEIATQSTSPVTGALTVAGGLGVTGNVNVGGNVNIAGTIAFSGAGTTVETANIAVVDPAIFVAKDNVSNLLDFSFVGTYASSGTKYTTITKKATDGIWRFVSGLSVKPTNTVDLTGAVYDTIQVGGVITAGNITVNTDKFVVTGSTGALSTAGTITTPEVIITSPVTLENEATTVAYVQSAISGTWATKTANYTLVNRDAVFANTSGGTFILTLPASPAANDRIRIADLAGTWGTIPVTLARNGNKIMGLSEDYSLNVKNASVDLIYTGTTYGWRFV